MLKVAIIERFYRCMCMCKIIESMLTQCIREREKGKIEIRSEKAWNTIGSNAWNQLHGIKEKKERKRRRRRRKESRERFAALLNPSIQFWVGELPAFRGKCTLPRRGRLWRTPSTPWNLPVVSPSLQFPSMDEIILSFPPHLSSHEKSNETARVSPMSWRKLRKCLPCIEIVLDTVSESSINIGREGVEKKLLVINPLTCLDAMSIYRTTLVLPCFFPLSPQSLVIPCRVFLEKFYASFTTPPFKRNSRTNSLPLLQFHKLILDIDHERTVGTVLI